MAQVWLLGMPVDAVVRLQRWTDDVLRELEIMEVGDTSGAAVVPVEVRDLVCSVLARYQQARSSAREQVAVARGAGRPRLDVQVDLPADAGDAAVELADLFDRVDGLARAGVLLSTAPAPELVALRRWAAAEVWRQLRQGTAPGPCPLAD